MQYDSLKYQTQLNNHTHTHILVYYIGKSTLSLDLTLIVHVTSHKTPNIR